jgi:NADPH2:quinone reductase
MLAIQFDTYGGIEVLHAAEIPAPDAGSGTVSIRVRAAAVNPADVKWRQGMFKSFAPINFPHILGYDVAGTVDAVGPNVTNLQVGDHVFAMLTSGGYAQFAVVPATDAVPMPAGLDFATAAALPTAGLTGIQMIEEHIDPSQGQIVLITGAVGAVGRFCMHAARRRGARVVAAVRSGQADMARSLGATEVILLGDEPWNGAPFDHVADTVGGPAVKALCRHIVRGGRLRTVATTPIDPDGLPSAPVFVIVRNDPARLRRLAEDVATGTIAVPIAKRLPLEAAAEAHRIVEVGGSGGKVILEPWTSHGNCV